MPTIVPSSLRVVDLRAELLKRKLPTKGKKDELIARLEEALKNELSEENATEEQNDSKVEEKGEEKKEKEEEEKEEKVVEQQENVEQQTQSEVKVEEPAKEVKPVEEKRSEEPPAAEIGHDQAEDSEKKDMDVDHDRGMKRKRPADNSKLAPKEEKRPKAELAPKPEAAAKTNDANAQAVKSKPADLPKEQEDTEQPKKLDKVEETSVATTEKPKKEKERGVTEPEKPKDTKEKKAAAPPSTKDETYTVSSSAIYIKGFLRPLIIRHVQEFIGKFGTVKRFWMDAIKTHCYVVYESQQEAQKAYEGINGVVFPVDTGRKLTVGGLTPEQAESLIEQEQSAAEKRIRVDWEAAIKAVLNGTGDSTATAPHVDTASGRRSRTLGITAIARQLQKAATAPVQQTIPQAGPEASPPVMEQSPLVETQEAPQGLSLEQLFRKTTAVPPLYYLTVAEDVARKRLESLKNEPTR
ncbi:hypothetical protein DFQ28_007395 [Apophysomyces sp. BC1034]|nr:hypothetical protein DFQ29_009390 [Apophysomyces sp. BC1021]KAG0186718.1 hypothetical protein DFQ28_007395 [Apophysomyces sp. BC1034]